jgi:hypothetical protein
MPSLRRQPRPMRWPGLRLQSARGRARPCAAKGRRQCRRRPASPPESQSCRRRLLVEDSPACTNLGGVGQRKVTGYRPLVAAAELDLLTVAEHNRAEAVPFRLVVHVGRDVAHRLRRHRLTAPPRAVAHHHDVAGRVMPSEAARCSGAALRRRLPPAVPRIHIWRCARRGHSTRRSPALSGFESIVVDLSSHNANTLVIEGKLIRLDRRNG